MTTLFNGPKVKQTRQKFPFSEVKKRIDNSLQKKKEGEGIIFLFTKIFIEEKKNPSGFLIRKKTRLCYTIQNIFVARFCKNFVASNFVSVSNDQESPKEENQGELFGRGK